MATAEAAAPLAAVPVLAASAGTELSQWLAWQAAEQAAAELWQQWRMTRSVAATDGTAGFLYGRAYTAQQAADAARQAYLAALERSSPGSRG